VIGVERRVTEIFLSQIELLPAFQGQGIGSQLITDLMDEARQQNLPITLQVLKVNPAQRLYQRLGFVVTGETATHFLMTVMPKPTV
jgi:ribosomal protein S18 acetylase RimI-like enzyme